MSILPTDINLPTSTEGVLRTRLYDVLKGIIRQLNSISYGQIIAYTALPSAPTTTNANYGDIIRNSDPQELGVGGNKYVISGWIYIDIKGWIEMRVLTGN